MKIEQGRWSASGGWVIGARDTALDADIVFVFGATAAIADRGRIAELRAMHPRAHLLGCSTAGEINGTGVSDGEIAFTAVRFDGTRVQGHVIRLSEAGDSREAGRRLALALEPEGLVHAFVLSDGLKTNGSELARGLSSVLPAGVSVTGGLSGDIAQMKDTRVLWNGGQPEKGAVAILGLYGAGLRVGFGSVGGWDPFGPERLVTESKGNVLYRLNGGSALDLYKKYLGRHALGLPAAALLFPLALRTRDGDASVVRTVLSIDESEQSMIFGGDIPQGAYARLMKANVDRLIDGAVDAARASVRAPFSADPDLAILISCVGRKMILGQRVEEEVEGVRGILGPRAALTGFYSYGELAPFSSGGRCELHNQTMTVTTFKES
ncbi:MAG: FIST C-terminal domain-containing protein [Elusimicrobia bacterium]|nr:FIST C-terminal domain-containing protein [Elusimicrobiota bacterium]